MMSYTCDNGIRHECNIYLGVSFQYVVRHRVEVLTKSQTCEVWIFLVAVLSWHPSNTYCYDDYLYRYPTVEISRDLTIMRMNCTILKRPVSNNDLNWRNFEGILPKGPYPSCLRVADRTLLAGCPRFGATRTQRRRMLRRLFCNHCVSLGKGTWQWPWHLDWNIPW